MFFQSDEQKKVRDIIQMVKKRDVAPLLMKITQSKKMRITAYIMGNIQCFEIERIS